MPKVDAEKDFWVVLDGIDPRTGLCSGFDSEEEAKQDAAARMKRAKELFGKDWVYKAVPKPA